MGRRSKDPEIRKMELIIAAEALFNEKGFEATSISDITDKVGLSHGAFFYYFDSKNEILKAVIHYYVGLDKELLTGILKQDMTAVKKIQTILDIACKPTEDLKKTGNKIVEYMHKEGNESLHGEYVRRTQEVILPLVTEIVEQGIREGVFDVQYPRETVEYVIHLFNEMQHDLRDRSQRNDAYYRKVRALEIIFTKVLGVKEGSIHLLT